MTSNFLTNIYSIAIYSKENALVHLAVGENQNEEMAYEFAYAALDMLISHEINERSILTAQLKKASVLSPKFLGLLFPVFPKKIYGYLSQNGGKVVIVFDEYEIQGDRILSASQLTEREAQLSMKAKDYLEKISDSYQKYIVNPNINRTQTIESSQFLKNALGQNFKYKDIMTNHIENYSISPSLSNLLKERI
ncbi:hypothetical protein SNEBB_000621 [Seison nebaliae]|nr:hypothetical protein SNEBB_000621 [Seison nebaliae]